MSSKFPRAVVFGPMRMEGMNLKCLATEQGVLQVMSYINSVYKDNSVGRMMKISLDAAQVEAGVSYDLLEYPTTVLPYLTECWITSLRSFLAKNDITLETDIRYGKATHML